MTTPRDNQRRQQREAVRAQGASARFRRSDATQAPGFDFDDDAGDRLLRLLPSDDARERLAGAARIAGQQLELITPAVVAVGARGFHAGAVADVSAGAAIVPLADAARVTTVHVGFIAGASATDAIEEMVRAAEEVGGPACGWDRGIASIVLAILEHAGGRPGEHCRDIGDAAVPILGALFATLAPAVRESLGRAIDTIRERAICPALVCLIGAASSGRPGFHSLFWPLLLPLAPYAEHVLRQAQGARADA